MTRNKKNILLLWVVLLSCAWLQSSHFPPWVSFHSEFVAFFAFSIVFVWVLVELAINDEPLKFFGVEIAIVAVLALVVLQVRLHITEYTGDTVVFTVYLLGMIFAIGAGRQLSQYPYAVELLAWSILLAGGVSVLIALLQSIHSEYQLDFVNPMPNWRRPGANLAQPNHLGTLVLWATVSAIYLSVAKKISKIPLSFLCIFFLLGLAMTESRTALLGAIAITAWLFWIPFHKKVLNRSMLALCFGVSAIALFSIWPTFITGFQEGGGSSVVLEAGGVNKQVGTRFLVWPQLVAAVMERPLMGWGLQGVSAALNGVLDRYTSSEPFSYAHNLILELAIWFGIPVTLLLVVLAIVWCVPRIKNLRNIEDWYAVALLIPFALHSMLEFPFAYAYFLLPACFAVGVLDTGRSTKVALRVSHKVAWAIFIAWLLVGVMVVRDYFFAEEDFRVARFEAMKMGKTPEEYAQPRLWMLDQLDAMNEATRIVPTPGMTEESLDLLRKAALRFPWTAIQNRYALALALNDNVPEARRQLKVMRAMHGLKTYEAIQERWAELTEKQYPQLSGVLSVH
nr:Wzy polymerase domain-containing protein [uncultured Rhodoferax sp.]